MTTTTLQATRWNLDDLLDGIGSVDAALAEAAERAAAFAERYRGALTQLDSAGLRDAMLELAAINELVGRAGSYAYLRFSTDTADPERGALLQRVQEDGTAIETQLLFWELEWVALPDERADELLGGDADLEFCRHHLRTARRQRPHMLSEPEERVLAEKAVTGRGAWVRLFEELTAAIEVDLEERVPLEVAMARFTSPSREVRHDTAAAVTAALRPGLRTRAYLFNTLLADKATDDRLRSYPNWLAARNLANEASDESVAALIDAVRRRYELPRRWYRLKASLLGLERLADYDRMAPVGEEDAEIEWEQAWDIVHGGYADFSPTLGEVVARFLDERWIDAPTAAGKTGGAYCSYTVPSAHPYVLLNYTGRRRDVLTLAHELGHGVHAALSAPQGVYHHHTPLTLMETASVFGEQLTMRRLLADAPSPAARLALLAQSVEDSIATVFRQVAMNRFEELVHTERRSVGELSVERFGELWAESQEELLGDAVEVTDDYRSWWSYIPHFIGSPGYVYAYAYGQLLALSLFEKRDEDGFEERYVELLSTGGSRPPEELAAIAGIDLADPGFWDTGLDLLERRLGEAEAAAAEHGAAAAQ